MTAHACTELTEGCFRCELNRDEVERHVVKPCPNCGSEQQGDPIPATSRRYYGNKTHYSRTIGVEMPGVYDGVLFWRCPDCGHDWHRFADPRMRAKAEPYMNRAIVDQEHHVADIRDRFAAAVDRQGLSDLVMRIEIDFRDDADEELAMFVTAVLPAAAEHADSSRFADLAHVLNDAARDLDLPSPWYVRLQGEDAVADDEPTTPHRCPTCNGHGTTNRPPWIAGDQELWTDNQTGPYPCRACQGTGVLWARG